MHGIIVIVLVSSLFAPLYTFINVFMDSTSERLTLCTCTLSMRMLHARSDVAYLQLGADTITLIRYICGRGLLPSDLFCSYQLLFHLFSSTVLLHFLHTSHVSCVLSVTKNPEFFHVSTLSVINVCTRK